MCRLDSHCVMCQQLTRVSLRSSLPVVSAASQQASHCSRAQCFCIAPAYVNRHSGGCRVPAGEQREILISEYSSLGSRPVDECSNYECLELLTSHSSFTRQRRGKRRGRIRIVWAYGGGRQCAIARVLIANNRLYAQRAYLNEQMREAAPGFSCASSVSSGRC